jgi:hypothetical protein
LTVILGLNAYHTDAVAEGRVIAAYEPEDLPGAIEEAMKRQKEKGKGKNEEREGKRSPMLGLVARAIEESIRK